jgi:hypothetical protein
MNKQEWADTLQHALDPYPDLDAADRNWIQYSCIGNYHAHHGALAGALLDAHDFEPTLFPFQVWAIAGWRTDGTPSAVLLANQSTLEGALRYMREHRILVYNRGADLERLAEIEHTIAHPPTPWIDAAEQIVHLLGVGHANDIKHIIEKACREYALKTG